MKDVKRYRPEQRRLRNAKSARAYLGRQLGLSKSFNFSRENTFVDKHTHNAGLWVPLATVAEGGRQGGGAALVVQGGASVVDG